MVGLRLGSRPPLRGWPAPRPVLSSVHGHASRWGENEMVWPGKPVFRDDGQALWRNSGRNDCMSRFGSVLRWTQANSVLKKVEARYGKFRIARIESRDLANPNAATMVGQQLHCNAHRLCSRPLAVRSPAGVVTRWFAILTRSASFLRFRCVAPHPVKMGMQVLDLHSSITHWVHVFSRVQVTQD